jgi:protein-S-isoprenylcysteine O-methyltransferase Ste14
VQQTLAGWKNNHNFAVNTAKTAAWFGILHNWIGDNTQRREINRLISHGFFSFTHSPLFFIATMGFTALFRSTVLALGLAMRLHLSFTATAAGAVKMTAITFSAKIKS